MPMIVPPVPSAIETSGEPPQARVHFRVQQVFLCLVTLGATAWLWSVHPVLGITAAFIAKHVLVAVLASGLTFPPVRADQKNDPQKG